MFQFLSVLTAFFLIASSAYSQSSCSALFEQPTLWSAIDEESDPITDRLPQPLKARLAKIQQEIKKHGIAYVLNDPKPKSASAIRLLEELFGVELFFAPKKSAKPKRIDKVLLHLGWASSLIHDFVGKMNLNRVDERILKKIEQNSKYIDYLIAERVAPGESLMPLTLNVGLEKDYKTFLKERTSDVSLTLSQFLKSGRHRFNPAERAYLESFIKDFFSLTETLLKNPGFIKYIGEAQTGDSKDAIVNTFKTEPRRLVELFELDLVKSAREIGAKNFGGTRLTSSLMAHDHKATYLLTALLTDPASIMVQERLDIAKLNGRAIEIRVDVIAGIPVAARARFGFDYIPPEYLNRAFDFTSQFFMRLPRGWNRLSAGVDVVFLKDGNLKFLEFNFGSESGFIYAPVEAIEANEFLASLTGQSTPLLTQLESLYHLELTAQRKHLESLRAEVVSPKRKISDVSRGEVASWLADRYASDWNGTPEHAREILLKLKYLFKGLKDDEGELSEILSSVKLYFEDVE